MRRRVQAARRGRERSPDGGFTLIELVLCIAILGVITVPLGMLAFAGFHYYVTTESTVNDSHDIQIATAYFSQDVASTGTVNQSNGNPQQSIWIAASGFPAGYCGATITGATPVVLLKWDDFNATTTGSATTATDTVDSAAYVVESGTLHRIFCAGSTLMSDALLVSNYYYPDSANASPVTCQTAAGVSATCTSAPAPAAVTFALSIKGPADAAPIQPLPKLTGDRRDS